MICDVNPSHASFTPLDPEVFISEQAFNTYLEALGIDTSRFTKDLFGEVQKQDCALGFDGLGQLERRVSPVFVDVLYQDQKLQETEIRHFIERREVKVLGSRNLPGSIGEKTLQGEKAEQAAKRGLQEELQIVIDDLSRFVLKGEPKLVDRPSTNYPNLTSRYLTTQFEITLRDEEYDPKGYLEDQRNSQGTGKTTTFQWVKC